MKASILLVDDEELILKSVSYALKKEGYQITTAQNGEEAVAKLKTADYDLVITDLQMEGMNGIEVLKEVKRINPDTFVIILTAHGTLASVVDAKRLGAVDYLLKPIDSLDLAARVANCLEKYEMQKQIKELKTKLAEYEKNPGKNEDPARSEEHLTE